MKKKVSFQKKYSKIHCEVHQRQKLKNYEKINPISVFFLCNLQIIPSLQKTEAYLFIAREQKKKQHFL